MRIGYAVMSTIVQQKSTFFIFCYIYIVAGVYCLLYINNIENSNRFSVGCSPLWADGKQTDKR